MTGTPPSNLPVRRLPMHTRIAMLLRLLAIQGSWNYEILLGNGIGFCIEPALRLLPEGIHSDRFKEAMARQSQYFNAHPYLASIAVGALARAELDGEPPDRIERFRTALAGPLGSVGDRLVWAGWLPFCSFSGLVAMGLGAGPLGTLVFFLALYNVGHLALRIWGLETGWRRGLRVATALGNPILRRGPSGLARAAGFAAGVALPLALRHVIGPGRIFIGGVLTAVVVGAVVIVHLEGRLQGWRLAIGLLAAFALFSVAR
jgi:mannose PTS system EIID component